MSSFKKTQIYGAVYGHSSWHDLHAVNGHACRMCLLRSELPDIIYMSLVGTTLLLFISYRFRPSQHPDAINSLHCDTRHGNPLPALPLHTHKQRADKVNQLAALEPLHSWYQALLALLNLINALRLNWYCKHQCYDAIFSRSQTVYINGFCTGLVILLICHRVFSFFSIFQIRMVPNPVQTLFQPWTCCGSPTSQAGRTGYSDLRNYWLPSLIDWLRCQLPCQTWSAVSWPNITLLNR